MSYFFPYQGSLCIITLQSAIHEPRIAADAPNTPAVASLKAKIMHIRKCKTAFFIQNIMSQRSAKLVHFPVSIQENFL